MDNRRILIVEVNWLGDVLFSTVAICALRNEHMGSFIACLVHKRCKDILVGNPDINEVIVLDEEGEHKGLRGKLKLIRQLKARNFDTVYLFHRSFTRTLICFLSGIKNRIGYYTRKRGFLLTESVTPPKSAIHRAAYYYYLITREIPSDIRVLRCDFFVTPDDVSCIGETLENEGIKKDDKLVVMHPAGNWPPKRWPKEYFAKLADKLIKEFNVKVIFSGSQKEKYLIDEILSLMENKALNFSERINLKQLGALFMRANLVISADSGPLHISVALDRPTIALFGPTSAEITGPVTKKDIAILQKDVGCVIPCYKQDCLDNRCMKQISPDDVINCIRENKWLQK